MCCFTLDDNQKRKKDEETNILLLLGADVPQGQTSFVKVRCGKMKINVCRLLIEIKRTSGGRKVWWFLRCTNSGFSRGLNGRGGATEWLTQEFKCKECSSFCLFQTMIIYTLSVLRSGQEEFHQPGFSVRAGATCMTTIRHLNRGKQMEYVHNYNRHLQVAAFCCIDVRVTWKFIPINFDIIYTVPAEEHLAAGW